MLMGLKYYEAANKIRKPNPKASYYEDYAAVLDFSFDNAPNVVYDEVEYEATYGELDFVKIDKVRVDTVLQYNTGIILGDDHKVFVFTPDFPIKPFYGMKFRWEGNYWLVINTNNYASMVTTAEVRRCNNVLRFFNEHGERVYEPCIMDYTLRFANNEDVPPISVGNGEQKIWCQRNKRTVNIKSNNRFLFGTPEQRVALRLYAGGTKNYLNGISYDDNSPTLSEFYFDHYEVNPLYDDIENGFADAYLNEVTVSIKNPITQLSVGDTDLLEANVFKGNTEIFGVDVQWMSSDDEIASIENNILTAHKNGEVQITVNIVGTDIVNTIDVSINDDIIEDLYEIIVEPSNDYVLQNKSQKYSVYLYKNGIKQENDVVFTDVSKNIPANKYTIIINDDNSFTLYNNGMYMLQPVVIRCTCGDIVKDLQIKLRGLY